MKPLSRLEKMLRIRLEKIPLRRRKDETITKLLKMDNDDMEIRIAPTIEATAHIKAKAFIVLAEAKAFKIKAKALKKASKIKCDAIKEAAKIKGAAREEAAKIKLTE
jgi:hypothetical protein